MSTTRNIRRSLQGVVSSDRMEKTIAVKVERITKHAKYGKYVRRESKYLAHDEENVARVGDTVEIMESRPLSKQKRWRLVRVVEAAAVAEAGGGAETTGGAA